MAPDPALPTVQLSGDIPPSEFRAAMHRAADLAADYLEHVGEYPVLARTKPGEVKAALPAQPPERGESMDTILADYRRVVEPNLTHWNHPGFMAYFGITGSGPGIVGETLAAALNVNAMLWRTSPAATELEEVATDWMRQLVGLPEGFHGHINDTASMSSFLALAVARHRAPDLDIRAKGLAGRPDVPTLTVYCSDQAHSSIDKAVIALGLGHHNLRKIPCDDAFRMDVPKLEAAIAADRGAGRLPIAVVATLGTTSSTSVDPIGPIADLAHHERMWLHVDAAYAGNAAVCPEYRALLAGWERADSIVFNPHKWLFTPVDCSLLYVKDVEELRAAFSLVPEYLRTPEQGVTNLMDFGVQLGRRFRALKLWMVVRRFGAEGIRERIRLHCALGREFAEWVRSTPGFEVMAPVPFSVVCFRVAPAGTPEAQDAANERILERVNRSGEVFLSHTRLHGRFVLRLAIGNLRTTRERVERAWALIREATAS